MAVSKEEILEAIAEMSVMDVVALIEAMEARAREAGSERFSLDVAAKNAGAQKLYKRHGLEIYARWPKRINLGKLGLYRMTKPL